jgi:NAD(P)-dependent dehydrogenase (short-subunit alcohol dehydrogenase family)
VASDSISKTRRSVVQGSTLGVIASVAGAAVAQSADKVSDGQARPDASAPAALRDPRSLYPNPPFPVQDQPWPALASRMSPRPDHGEESYRGRGRLTGRRALITGGDSGIGRAVAIAYAREGADVALGYLPQEEEDASAVVALIRQAGRKAVALPGDIRDEGFCRAMVARAADELGGLDILVNNAARQHNHDSILDISTEEFDWTVKTNLYGMFWITKAAIAHMPAGSAIINTSSFNAYEPEAVLLDYAMTKAGIAIFTKALAKQLVSRGIRVNAVAPGPFWTPLQVCSGQHPDRLQNFGKDLPMGRPGQPAEIAPIYVQLADAASSYITGQVYGASGGAGLP